MSVDVVADVYPDLTDKQYGTAILGTLDVNRATSECADTDHLGARLCKSLFSTLNRFKHLPADLKHVPDRIRDFANAGDKLLLCHGRPPYLVVVMTLLYHNQSYSIITM